MKIAVYKDTFAARRGADVAVQFLVDGLRARGHDVVAVTDEDADVRGRISGCDVCIAAGTNEMLSLTDGGRNRPPAKTILQFHTHPLYPFRHWLRRWRRCRAIRRAIALADAVQVLLPSHEGVLRRKVGYAGKVYVIGNASRFGTCASSSDDGQTIIYPAALNDDKRQMLLIDAFARVAGDFPGWRVVLYGTGKAAYEAKLRARVAAADGILFLFVCRVSVRQRGFPADGRRRGGVSQAGDWTRGDAGGRGDHRRRRDGNAVRVYGGGLRGRAGAVDARCGAAEVSG